MITELLVSLAYIGPGTGLSAVGALIAVVAGILLAIVGFVWYPLKRLLRKKPTESVEEGAEKEADETDKGSE